MEKSGEKFTDDKEMSSEVFSIYILKSNPTVLTNAESYLRNRGCVVGSGSNMKEALAYIIQKQPQYVLLSADHPNKKVKILPKLLAQAFPVRVIGFAEKPSGSSVRNLNEMGLEYTLFPPVSGPSIQRLIRKIRKDDEQKAQQKLNNANNPSGQEISGNDKITFKGENSARDALNQLLNASNEEAAQDPASGFYLDKGQGSQSGPAYIPNSGAPGENAQNAASSGPAEGEDFDTWAARMREAAQLQAQAQGEPAGAQFQFMQPGSHTDPQAAAQGAPGTGPNYTGSMPGASQDPLSARSGANYDPASYGGGGAGITGPDGSDGGSPKDRDPNSPSHPIMESEYKRKENKGYTFSSSAPTGFQKSDSIIVRGTQQALDQTVNYADGRLQESLATASNMACITVESPRFSGYLICALGKNKKIDKALIATIQKKLFEFLRSNGEPVNEEDTMNIRLQEVEFEDWALEQADFLKKSIHEGNEIAMAFFPASDMRTQLEDSVSEKMLKMTIDEFKSDVPIEFDLYVYMPENKKYLLYTPQGMKFYGNQKNRLVEKGVTHLHLRKDSAQQVKKYRTQNYLNEKIEAYKMAAKIKKSSS